MIPPPFKFSTPHSRYKISIVLAPADLRRLLCCCVVGGQEHETDVRFCLVPGTAANMVRTYKYLILCPFVPEQPEHPYKVQVRVGEISCCTDTTSRQKSLSCTPPHLMQYTADGRLVLVLARARRFVRSCDLDRSPSTYILGYGLPRWF